MIIVELKSDTKKIFLSGNLSADCIDSLKKLGYRQVPGKRALSVTYDIYINTKNIILNYSQIYESDLLLEFLDKIHKKQREEEVRVDSYLLNYKGPFKLYPFQEEFVRWVADPTITRTACLNASEPGLGKTCSSLAAIFYSNPKTPLIILCPRNAIGVWKWHLEKSNYPLPIIEGQFLPGNCACICTYESIPPRIEEADPKKEALEGYKNKILQNTVLIADEFHLTKNHKAKKTLRFRELFKIIQQKEGKVLALTGTPVLNRPYELKVLLDNIDLFKKAFGNATNFYRIFGGEFNYHLKRLVWDPKKRIPNEIKNCLKNVLFIKKKKDVLNDLPARVDTVIKVEVSKKNKKELDNLNEKYKDANLLLNSSNSDKLDFTKYTQLRQALSIEKFEYAKETIFGYEEIDKQIIVFSDFLYAVEELGKRPGWKSISGATSSKNRAEYQELFNAGKLKGLAITIKAGSTALSLTNTDTMLFIDLNLVPGNNSQARQRIDRINKLNKNLFYTYFLIDHPLEEAIQKILLEKEKLISETI